MTLAQKLLALHDALSTEEIPHAFGGAISHAYWTHEPRGTRDIDVKVFCPEDECEPVLAALPSDIAGGAEGVEAIRRDGQVRLWWEDTPVDLFFDHEPLHAQAARARHTVPFEGTTIPVLGPVELAVFKAMFDRTRDWADIEAMAAAGNLDVDAVRDELERLVGDGDERIARLGEALRRARPN